MPSLLDMEPTITDKNKSQEMYASDRVSDAQTSVAKGDILGQEHVDPVRLEQDLAEHPSSVTT